MSLWKIALRSVQQRGFASLLTAFSMSLGVMLVVGVLSIHGVIRDSFRNNASLGYNMIVGAKGGKLQLTLNTVYYLSTPVENIDYAYYLEFVSQERRDAEYANSIQSHAHEALLDTLQLQSLSAGVNVGPGTAVPVQVAQGVVADSTARHGDFSGLFATPKMTWERGRDTRFGAMTDLAIPLCLGDYYGKYRVVGTTPELVDKLRIGVSGDRALEFSEGRNFETFNEEHTYFEAVVGAKVARSMGVKVGDELAATHGDPEDGELHDQKFTVVGILKPTGTPHDRVVFVNMEGFFLMESHAKPIEDEGFLDSGGDDDAETTNEGEPSSNNSDETFDVDSESTETGGPRSLQPLPIEQREVTALLVRTSPLVALYLPQSINEGSEAQAVLPIREISNLFDIVVQPVQWILLALTAMICVVSGVAILVSIYNSMSDRRHEIAVMRALGAGRGTVMTVILLESIILSLGGGLLGWFFGHTLNVVASPVIENQTGVRVGFFDLAPGFSLLDVAGDSIIPWVERLGPMSNFAMRAVQWPVSSELLLVPALVLLAIVVGFLPALAAYRTDVAKSLGN